MSATARQPEDTEAARARAALGLLADLAVVVDARGQIESTLGPGDLSGSFFAFVAPPHRRRARAAHARATSRGERVEYDAALTGPGVADIHHVTVAPAPGEPDRLLVCARRNGQLIRERACLLGERTRFEVAVKHAPTPIEITDPQLRIQYVNEAWETLTGYAMGDATGTGIADRCVEPAVYAEIERHARDGVVWQGRVRSRRRDGSVYEEELTLYPGCDENGRILHFVGVRSDVTETQRLRETQMANDRLVTIGTLTAGVAHEIRNALVPIIGGVSFLKDAIGMAADALPADLAEEIDDALFDAEEAVERVRLVSSDLNCFSRASPGVQSLDLHRVLESSARLASDQFKRRARLVCDFAPVPPLDADQARLGQVFLNLILNAAHAIEPGQAEDNAITLRTTAFGDERIVVEVTDSGLGITPEVLPRIFEPFFTTKPAGQGTGLGLPICRRIVQELGGEISVRSKVGEGTTFRVDFPVNPATLSAEITCDEIRAARRARILIIDDEHSISRSFGRILKKHDVEVAPGGREGLQRLLSEDFDLVFCDLIMPGVTGMDVYERLHALRPEVAESVIFMTGGAYSDKLRRFVESVPNDLLEKPFSVDAIRAVVARRTL